MSRHETDTRPSDGGPEPPAIELDHVTVENDDAPDECAVFPKDASEEQLLSSWIAAHEHSFVDLETMR
ncbi:DUF7511 domain-containing protein [Natronobacterium gregoryi]|uniref:DUF7511 domain-containing protein n=2 Tax=Natronobacterium gregoryi TaxID=44930 RepID=L0AGQ2_NATGS|nr:hypothetical protein [Natronobacterium gregoryi]AFZ72255.1 hypothetical protein Natgr_1024 [Natronobacterium gregoryi SP2]ELY62345.1 hypothetical protein C490_18348 [Natronobacterium gregoryi SP2]PLK20202.1 hypothetical protein CYV19_10945 [Natronobacterium gregoryi SP2]SFJ29018.1 hypothetical protein SAMN05443661_12053 [Natronobacterium gregoryi]